MAKYLDVGLWILFGYLIMKFLIVRVFLNSLDKKKQTIVINNRCFTFWFNKGSDAILGK